MERGRASTAAEEPAHGVHAPAQDVLAKRPDWQAWRRVWGHGRHGPARWRRRVADVSALIRPGGRFGGVDLALWSHAARIGIRALNLHSISRSADAQAPRARRAPELAERRPRQCATPCYAGRYREKSSVREPMTVYGVDAFVEVVRQRIETEGLRPFSMRTGIPLGQLRSVVQGRAARYTTLESIASVMGMRLFIAPVEPGGMEAPPLPAELTRALDLPSDASVIEAVDAIDQDAVASMLRKGMRLVQEMTELATAAAELLPQVAGGSTTRMIPFAEQVQFEADTGEVAFEESSDLSIAVAEKVLPSWARAARLTCVRTAGDSLEPADGALVVVDKDRRVAVDEQLCVVRIGEAWWSSAFGRSAVSGAWSAWLICRDP